MRTFLPHSIVDTPFELISHGGSATRDNELLLKMLQAREARVPMTPPNFASIKIRPHLIADALVNDLLGQEQKNEVLNLAPALLFRVMSIAPAKMYSGLAPVLTNDLESVERLLAMSSEKRFELPAPYELFMESLKQDPNRYHRMLPEDRRHAEMENIKEMALNSQSPASIFFVARTNPEEQLPDPALMNQDEEYAYLLAKLLHSRGITQEVYGQYTSSLTNPRWVYHALRDQLMTRAAIEEAPRKLLAQPEWLVEWLHRNRAGESERKFWIKECNESGSLLQSDLDLWLRTALVRDFVHTSLVA